MKETKSEISNISNSKNRSLPFSLSKYKRSKIVLNKATQKHNQSHKKSISKQKIKEHKKLSDFHIINSQLQKHNSNPLMKNIMIINDIIETKTNHFLAIFKDYLITDYIDEFLKRYFEIKESEEFPTIASRMASPKNSKRSLFSGLPLSLRLPILLCISA